MNKQVYKFADIRKEILEAVDIIADPVRGTISPKGRNVVLDDEDGMLNSTNDGVTIARSIYLSDPVKNAIVQIIKGSSVKTNADVGDGTSTTILLTQTLIRECFKLIDAGWNPMDLKKQLQLFRDDVIKNLEKQKILVKNDEDLRKIAKVSANNDSDIADNIVKVVQTAGLDGMVFIETNNKVETELIEEMGFAVNGGMAFPELRTHKDKFAATYQDVPMLVTDKRIYYPEEAETILKTIMMAGYKSVVIVARDFIGQAPATFLANHQKGVVNVLLVKDNSMTDTTNESGQDLAAYLDTELMSDKTGRIVDNLTIDDFVIVDKVYSDPYKTLITSKNPNNKQVKSIVAAIRKELLKNKDDQQQKRRLASLTNGMVTIKIGGATPIEVREKMYRYEDAISSVRAAMRDGYLVGGGVAVHRAVTGWAGEFGMLADKFAQANIKQIVENCGDNYKDVYGRMLISASPYTGYNAVTEKVEDLAQAGIFDPYAVTENAVRNSISVASEIISSNYLIIEEPKKD